MKIGDKIRQNRNKARYTQEQLASRIGVSAQSVSKWENEISMPDITLLPRIAEIFGVTIDDLFDLSVDQKLKRIENRLDIEEDLPAESFKEYEEYLKDQLHKHEDKAVILSLLANLYHHRMEADGRRVSKYGREAILLKPEKKDCQWLLSKSEGHAVWDWNVSNHSDAIDFYKKVIEADHGNPKTSLPYYYLIDNLLADNRTIEAEKYLYEFSELASVQPVMVEIYKAYIALGEFNVNKADKIIEECEKMYSLNSTFLFEAAQYYARRCKYEKALSFYERSWAESTQPRYTDALQGIAIINKILGNKEGAIAAYDRILDSLVKEWGYSLDDMPCIEIEREKAKLK